MGHNLCRYTSEEEITTENEARVAKRRFENMMNARERERIAAPWVREAAPGRNVEAGDGESRPPRTRVVINPRNGTVTVGLYKLNPVEPYC
jgi:hypothetical protein